MTLLKLKKSKEKKSIFIKEILGYEGREEVVHRDYLFLEI